MEQSWNWKLSVSCQPLQCVQNFWEINFALESKNKLDLMGKLNSNMALNVDMVSDDALVKQSVWQLIILKECLKLIVVILYIRESLLD